MTTRTGADEFSEYVEEETGRGWRKIKRIKNGIEFKLVGSKTIDYINALRAENYGLQLNTMVDRIEVVHTGKAISDFDEAVMINRLQDFGLNNEGRMRNAFKEFAVYNKYHPVRKYLQGLEYDGGEHFSKLMEKISIRSDLGETFFRKFLIGAIAKAIDNNGDKQNFMLVLMGAQGKGKSRLVRWLCPLSRYFYEGPVNPEDKDCQVRLISNWLWEVAELDSTTRRSDRSALKHFVTQSIVKVRVPYGRYDIEKAAAASMIGTINSDGAGFLNDPTGSRRFAVIELTDIDWSYASEVDINQLWAELYNAYKNGESWELTPYEREVQHAINAEHSSVSVLEELLTAHFTIDPTSEAFMSGSDILEKLEDLGLKGDQSRNSFELASVATKLGLTRCRKRAHGRLQRGYSGISLDEVVIK